MTETEYRSYPGGEEPACEVEVDGTWRGGYVRAWGARPYASPPGRWAFVIWSRKPSGSRPDWFPASRVRELSTPDR